MLNLLNHLFSQGFETNFYENNFNIIKCILIYNYPAITKKLYETFYVYFQPKDFSCKFISI